MTEQEFKANFIHLMMREEVQLPRRMEGSYASSLSMLLDTYREALFFMNAHQQKEIEDICHYLKHMTEIQNSDDVLHVFTEMMEKTKLSEHLHIIRDELPIDGYGIKNANLFRIREYRKNVNYSRKDIFHVPVNANTQTRAYRYNIAGFPSLYLSSTIYGCCCEMEKGENDKLIGSMFRLKQGLPSESLYIVDLGVRPADFVKSQGYSGPGGRRNYRYTDYLYVYPLIAACSFLAADKSTAYIREYSISNALFRWLYLHKSAYICGVRYFSCARCEYMIRSGRSIRKEAESKASFTKYFINYALSIESTTSEFSNKLSDAFVVTKPKHLIDSKDIKDFETSIKKDVNSLRNIYYK